MNTSGEEGQHDLNDHDPGAAKSDHAGSVGADALVAALAAAVAGYPRRRIPLESLRLAFAQHDPTGATISGARVRLHTAIGVLAARGDVVLPKQRKLYETHAAPPLPDWVDRRAEARSIRLRPNPRLWRPELADAAALATEPAEFDVLDRVDRFLRNGGGRRPSVPHRERSLELFGNEKRLDALLRTRLFTGAVLTLELLRCFRAPLPLTAVYVGTPGPYPQLLIVENHSTYASVLAAARDRAAAGGTGFAVGYGAGSQLPTAIGGVSQLDPVPAALWYFGDLDVNGLRIPRDASTAAVASGLPPLRPALPLYRLLLEDGVRQVGKAALDTISARALTKWLEDDVLRSDSATVLIDGCRIAQETVGYEALGGGTDWW